GREERQPAAGAGEDARPLLVVERARARALGAFLAHDMERVGGQLLLPLVLRELDRLARRGDARAGRQEGLPVLLQFLYAFHRGRGRSRRLPRKRGQAESLEYGAPIHWSPFRVRSRLGRAAGTFLTVYSGRLKR